MDASCQNVDITAREYIKRIKIVTGTYLYFFRTMIFVIFTLIIVVVQIITCR